MKPSFASIIGGRAVPIAAATVAVVASLAGCGGAAEPDTANAGGSAAAGTGSASAGSGGAGTAGASGAGVGAGGAGGASTAGVGEGGSSSGGSSGGSAILPTFDTVKLVLQGGGGIMPCAAAPCHGVNGMAPPGAPLELPPNDDQQLYTNLTSYVSRACGNTKLVTAGDPEQSALLKILSGPCGMTPRMPYMCTDQDGNCIPDEYIAALRQWIANGAPR